MSKRTGNSLFIDSSLPGLYQHLVNGIASFEELGNRILIEIESACAFRQVEQVRQLGTMLSSLPLREYQYIGQYYLLWCQGRESNYNTEALERIIEQTKSYKTRAIFSLAAFQGFQRRIELAMYYYAEALKTSPSVSEYIDLSRGIAVLKAVEGFHQSAISDLEKLIPLIKYSKPVTFYDFLNSYAVELGAAGRKGEARNIIKLALASPYAFAYPEWFETAEELKPANRSFVLPDPSPAHTGILLRMPQPEPVKARKLNRPAKVINLQQWKKQMGKDDKESGKLTPEQLKAMTPSEKLIYILQSIDSDFTDDDFDKVIEVLDQIKEKKKKNP